MPQMAPLLWDMVLIYTALLTLFMFAYIFFYKETINVKKSNNLNLVDSQIKTNKWLW